MRQFNIDFILDFFLIFYPILTNLVNNISPFQYGDNYFIFLAKNKKSITLIGIALYVELYKIMVSLLIFPPYMTVIFFLLTFILGLFIDNNSLQIKDLLKQKTQNRGIILKIGEGTLCPTCLDDLFSEDPLTVETGGSLKADGPSLKTVLLINCKFKGLHYIHEKCYANFMNLPEYKNRACFACS